MKITHPLQLLPYVLVLVLGILLTTWSVSSRNASMRAMILNQAEELAANLEPERVKAMQGETGDIVRPEYLRLKNHFAAYKNIYQHCPLYLSATRASGRKRRLSRRQRAGRFL